MPWFNLSFSDFIKKRVCKFLINRYLGQFFEEKLTADQICLDLYNGLGSVYNVNLCSEAINGIFEAQGWDFEVTSGSIGSVTVNVPWNCLMSEDSFVEVNNLCLCLRPQPRAKDDGTTMLESMWSSMSSSMQLAQECLEKNEEEEAAAASASASNMEGLEKFAQTIDNILNRIKAKFINTEVRLEYLPKDSDVGVALIIKLKSFEYQNEASSDTEKDEAEKSDQKTILFATHATHHIALEDITFYTEEFRIGVPKTTKRSRNESTKSSDDVSSLNTTATTDPYLSAISSFSADNEMFYSESGTITNESEEHESDESDDENDNIYRSEMIMIGRLMNRQEIRINMKQAENIEGPKVDLQMSIGALTLFSTPRQLHMLLLLCDILLNGEAPSSGDNEMLKEMSPPRQSRVEEEKRRFGGLMSHQTWSGDDYEYNNDFMNTRDMHFINKLRPVGSDSVFSSNSSSMTSSIGSSASQNTSRRRRAIERDQNADISHFSIRVAGIHAVLLHEDVLVSTSRARSDESPLNESSVEKMRKKCEYFFNCVSENIGSCSTSDLMKIGNILKKACDSNHLRLMFAPVIVDGEERRTVKGNRTKLNISIPRVDVHEILADLCLPILEFQRKDSTSLIPEQPEVSINMEKTFYVMRSSSGKQFTAPRLNLGITLTTAKLDFDITIFDRISALFSSPFSCFMSDGLSSEQDYINELPPSSQKIVQSKSKIKVQSDCLSLVLRFPIVDLRPLHDPEKRPWWQRHVRPDFLVIKFSDFQLNFISPSTYDVIAHEINVQYHESEKASPITVAKASLYENISGKYYTSAPDYPRIVIQMPTDTQLQELNENFIREQKDGKGEDTDSDPASGESFKINPMKVKESTPFSTKKVCRESDTPHGKDKDDESETLLIPGDRDEINSFCDKAMTFSKIQIKVHLPVVSVQLKSKHLYEIIYNRIISDILMWESSVPKAKPPEIAISLKKPPDSLKDAGMMDSIYAPFAMCTSNINFESDASAPNSESEGESDPVYFSVSDKNRLKTMVPTFQKDYSNNASFQLFVGQGLVTMYAPVRDSQNHVIPGQLGEFVLKVNSTTIFTVSKYHGSANLGYFCIQSGNLEMYHGVLPVPIQNIPLRDISCILPAWLKSTLYSTPKNLTLNECRGSNKRDMLSLAVQIKANPEQGLKRCKISVGVQCATLKHNSTLPEHFWLTQLMDMFDVKDDIVPGYTPYTNISEFHLHLWDCAVDYRPLHYPFRAVATIGTFMISSNIATGSVGCTLRFVAEEVALSMAPQSISSKDKSEDNKISALPSIDLICVAELGLFEISLRLNEKVTPLSPKYDLRAAIKDVHIRTCSDSGKALLDFVTYLSSEGDLVDEHDIDDAASQASSMHQMNEPEDELLQMKTSDRTVPEVTPTQQQHVRNLMAEAMEESIFISNTRKASNESDDPVDLGTDVFFFPDEHIKKEIRFSYSTGATRKTDSYKRRCASEDSISIDSSSYREDEEIFVKRFEPKEEDAGSISAEMRELLDFETSVMIGLKEPVEDFDPLPQVEMDLGDISKYEAPPKRAQPVRKPSSDSDEDFIIIADEERPCYGDVPVVQSDDPIRIIDNHFSAPHGKPDLLKAPADFPMAVQRYTLCEMSLIWHMYGGHDFPNDDDKKKEREERDEINRRAFSSHYPMSEVYKMGVSYTKGSPNLTLGGSSQPKLTWKTRGGYGRKHDELMEFYFNKVRFSHETYPSTTEQASRQVLLVSELEIRDKMAISNINKFLYHPTVGFRTRQGNNHMVVIKALHLRPEPALKRQECCLRISLLPIRLNIDQDSLLFLITFFIELSNGDDESKAASIQSAMKQHQPPVMMVELPEAAQELQARKLVSENLTLLLNEDEKSSNDSSEAPSEAASDSSSPIFFRHIIFSPEVPIRIDYQGKRVEMSHGPLAGLLMGLGQLQCSEIRLKKINYRHGILGVDKLINFLIQEWLQDIKKRQLPKILGGVGPMYSLVQLFQGLFDLFWLPIEQYQKDGRIVRGLQRGAQSFTARTALAALEITSRIIYLLQITAETAYDMVSPAGPSVRRRFNHKNKKKRLHPPQDIREGMSNAYHIVRDGIGDTAQTIIQMAAHERDQKGYPGAVGAVMRQIPPTVVRPLVLATQATTNVLGGLKNELIPNARIEAKEKWKDDDEN